MKHRTTRDAHDLLLRGQLAMAAIERNGVRVDKDRLETTIVSVTERIAEMERELKQTKVFREWERAYGDKTNFNARDQLADVLFNKLGMKSGGTTTKGHRHSTSKDVLEMIDDPFVRQYRKIEPIKNSLRVNLKGIQREMVEHSDGNWYVHPNNNLNTVVTFRPSSSDPNWKNFPKRNKEIAELVRPIFIARPGRRFVEVDQAQIEVRVPACARLANDPELIRYINDPKSDMHRDQACNVWMLRKDEVSKPIRQTTKTNFVFAGFYGSPYFNTAKRLWDDIERYELKTEQGVPLKEHLARKGIRTLGRCEPEGSDDEGTFVGHVAVCEQKLWEKFIGYWKWKQKQVENYHLDGGMTMVTGFAVNGPHARTEIANYGIQGPAYHITLWSVCELLDELRRRRMKTRLLGEIYDSIQMDVPKSETDDCLDLCTEIMTERVREHWDWITVPLSIECEVSPVNGSWWECEEWVRHGSGSWSPKKRS
jgi:DNA polymerase-1